MRQYAVNEIFYSIQGEGRNTGRAAVFIRLSGCNLKCPFCDTDHRQHTLMTAKEIAQEAVALVTPWHRCEEKTLVVLTGGEPSLQVDTELTAELHASIYCEIAMETNGTRMVAEGVDWITLSPKDIFVEGAMPVLTQILDDTLGTDWHTTGDLSGLLKYKDNPEMLGKLSDAKEIAFVSSNRMRAEMDKEKSVFTQKLLSVFYSHPNGFVSTMLVGNNIVLVVYGILFAKFFDKTLFEPLDVGMRVAADTILSTIVVLFTGEFLPKTLFKNNANKLLTLFSPIAYFFYIILWPISKFSTLSAKFLLRLIGKRMEKEDDDEGFSKVDLDYLVHSSLDNAKADSPINDEVKIFQNALEFSDIRVRDCMVPRTEINAVSIDCSIAHLYQQKSIPWQ